MVIQKKQKIGLLIFLFIIAIIIWIFVFKQEGNKFLKVEFFDIGQGDAIFIETMDKKQILIDGGPDLSILEKIGREMPFYDRYIDLIILSHPEADHLSGLIEIIKRYQIGAIIMTGIFRDTEQYKEWLRNIERKNIPIYLAKSGGEINFNNGIRFDILYPFETLVGKELSESNNTSIVGKLVYNNFEALFTGDIEKSVENKLISAGVNLKSDILKIAHHGSKTSTSEEFLKAVNAILAVIPVGKDNKYGHPHQEVLERLANLGIFQTDRDGDVEILSDGINFFVKK
ncbi:MAG: ComEC/Rec2 family competence protein [Patescibacteria group bacterium]